MFCLFSKEQNAKIYDFFVLWLPCMAGFIAILALAKDVLNGFWFKTEAGKKESTSFSFKIVVFLSVWTFIVIYIVGFHFWIIWKVRQNHRDRTAAEEEKAAVKLHRQEVIKFQNETRQYRKAEERARKNADRLVQKLTNEGFLVNQNQFEAVAKFANDIQATFKANQNDSNRKDNDLIKELKELRSSIDANTQAVLANRKPLNDHDSDILSCVALLFE